MEEILDFDDYIKNQTRPDTVYWAVYSPSTGEIQGIYPNNSADDFSNKLQISKDLAESIIEGKVQLTSCFVNVTSSELEIIQSQSLRKIDDVLHRVIDKKWSPIKDADIFIEYFQEKKNLKVSMTERFYGTRKSKKLISKRKIEWKGSTELLLLVTDYNDPNVLYYMLSLTVNDLIGKNITFNNIEVSKKFSIYTRRVFKNYILDIK
jgi:hypothetical protein